MELLKKSTYLQILISRIFLIIFIYYFSEWSPPGQARVISVTGCNYSQVVCASGPILFHLEVKDGKLVQNGDTTLEYEVACIGKRIIPKNCRANH